MADNHLKLGRNICWADIGKELNQHDDACLKKWKVCAPVEQLDSQKTLQVKRILLRPPYVDISNQRKSSLRSENIDEDILSEQPREE